MNRRKKWLLLSLTHPAISVTGLTLGSLPSMGMPLNAILYFCTLLAFVLNLPGIWLVQSLQPVIDLSTNTYVCSLLITVLTWAIVVLPVCMLISLRGNKTK